MNIHEFQETLTRATVDQLAHVIDWIARPSAPSRNDALRALFHAARRDPAGKGALIEALVREVLDLRPHELRRVARTLGCRERHASTHDLLRAIAAQLTALPATHVTPPPSSPRGSFEIDPLLGSVIDLAGRVLGSALRHARSPHHRAGGRRRHG